MGEAEKYHGCYIFLFNPVCNNVFSNMKIYSWNSIWCEKHITKLLIFFKQCISLIVRKSTAKIILQIDTYRFKISHPTLHFNQYRPLNRIGCPMHFANTNYRLFSPPRLATFRIFNFFLHIWLMTVFASLLFIDFCA